MSHPP
ncbi:hypothetical protein YPPY02_3463, partial [Yersinia pestis PY-02]